jgi:hypothetical protein
LDWTSFWVLVETVSDLLYEPLLFWGMPFIPAIVLEAWKWRRDESS